jgi:ABC-2 type transport system ATP-binding protein
MPPCVKRVRSSEVIHARSLVRDFGSLRAVDGLSFEAEPGEIYGLLGPNGAGKTTAMRLLAALLVPTSGDATIAGYSIAQQPHAVRARVGILTEVPGLYARLTPLEYLDFFAELYGVTGRAARVEEMLRLVGLWERRTSVMRTFSKGQQQRVAIARTLIHDPPVLLFDEPTAALDPEAARSIRDYVRHLAAARGRTILLCTHNLPEAEELCGRLSIVSGGRQLAEGSPAELKARVGTTVVLRVASRPPDLLSALARLVDVDDARADGAGTISYRTFAPERDNPRVVRATVESGVDVLGLGEAANSLEDAYLRLIGTRAP